MDEHQLLQVFGECNVAWVFADHPSENAARILAEMSDVDQAIAKSFTASVYGGRPVAEAILADTERFKPLVHAFASPMSAPIRAMIYCVLNGAQIKGVRFAYRFKTSTLLEVDIEYEPGSTATFVSTNIWDAEALHHFGLMEVGDSPVVDGYYAFRAEA